MFPGTHQCITAQIVYPLVPIQVGAGINDSNLLAQRNLSVTPSDNPGPPSTHRVPQTFDVGPSQPSTGPPGTLLSYPDELMISWGNTPVGSIASIYWPQVPSADVLALASKFYSTHQFSASDGHTIQCTVTDDGVTFVPIPTGSGRFAGLFTVEKA
jgi:hypothetical protein